MSQPDVMKRLHLEDGQFGDDSYAHNGRWYDKNGRYIGWGDIGTRDRNNIQQNLLPLEVFFVVPEEDAWRDVMHQAGIDTENPGIDWVVSKASFFMTVMGLYMIDRDDSRHPGVMFVKRDHLWVGGRRSF